MMKKKTITYEKQDTGQSINTQKKMIRKKKIIEANAEDDAFTYQEDSLPMPLHHPH